MSHVRLSRLFVILAVVFTVGLAACGSDGDDDASDTTVPVTEAETADEASPQSAVTAQSADISWVETELSATAGAVEITLENTGQIPHSFVIEGLEDDLKLEVSASGDTDTGTVDLDAGEFTFYCDVPGHRAAGMEGTLTVS